MAARPRRSTVGMFCALSVLVIAYCTRRPDSFASFAIGGTSCRQERRFSIAKRCEGSAADEQPMAAVKTDADEPVAAMGTDASGSAVQTSRIADAAGTIARDSPVALVLLASILGTGSYVTKATQNPGMKGLRDPKGILHSLRVHGHKNEHAEKSVLSRFFYNDKVRQRNTASEGGLISHALADKMPVRKWKAVTTGVSTSSIGMVAAALMHTNGDVIKSILAREKGAPFISSGFTELKVGGVYESRDDTGNWWPVIVESANEEGTYNCRFVLKGVAFENPMFGAGVWPENCRHVTQRTLVEESLLKAIV